MKITVVTLFPQMISPFVNESIVKRAQEKSAVEIALINLRDFAENSYGSVDDRPYGGGAGMLIQAPVLYRAVSSLATTPKPHIVLTSARGVTFSQKKAIELSQKEHLVIVAGHYEGFDERVSSFVDEEISIGDFILTGGEIPAAAIVDSVVRLLPNVLKKNNATTEESFVVVQISELIAAVGAHPVLSKLESAHITSVSLLEYPHYTRPETFQDSKVPEVLLSGDPKKIRTWQLIRAFECTLERRPDLLLTGDSIC